MKTLMKAVVTVMLIFGLSSLFGCKHHILDGPGMVNIPSWKSFTLSRDHSDAQYNFSFTVTDDGYTATVTGECCDEEGQRYENHTGIRITADTLTKLRLLELDQLADSETDGDLTGSAELSLTYFKDAVKKDITEELSMQIYQLLLPYFVNQ